MLGFEAKHHEQFAIGGQLVDAASAERVNVIGASTGEVIGSVPKSTIADVDRAVGAARRAFNGGWSQSEPAERAAVLRRFADAIEKRAEIIGRTVSAQNGMPLWLSRQLESAYIAAFLRYYAELAKAQQIEERRRSPLGFDTLVRREPVGVVAGIIPWNFPVLLSMMKIGPALATGCTIVLKPSPGTPLDSYLIAEAAQEAGVPAGVLNWVPGERDVGSYLVAHPGIDKVAFTGSGMAGRKVAEVCARLLRPVTLELGGKSAAIILDDAKTEDVINGLLFSSFGNNGQMCAASTRVLAPQARYKEIIDALASMASTLKVGHALDPETQIGPMASAEHRARVERYIAMGKEEARLVAGGGRPKNVDARGWFVQPTVFADVSNSATIAREEIFGPVLCVMPYRDEDEAIRIANDSDLGLAGTVWSSDVQRASSVARRVQSGTVGINGYVIDFSSPFGGVKGSGLGREFGPESLHAYQQLQSIYLPAVAQ